MIILLGLTLLSNFAKVVPEDKFQRGDEIATNNFEDVSESRPSSSALREAVAGKRNEEGARKGAKRLALSIDKSLVEAIPLGHFLLVTKPQQDYENARLACQQWGGDLATPTPEEQKQILAYSYDGFFKEFLVGSNRAGSFEWDPWKWYTGEALTSEAYAWAKEKNDYEWAQCLTIDFNRRRKGFHNTKCGWESPFICSSAANFTALKPCPSTTDEKPTPKEGGIQIDKSKVKAERMGRFLIVKKPQLNYNDARLACQQFGGDLATPTPEEQGKLLQFTLQERFVNYGWHDHFWVGASRVGFFEWDPWQWHNCEIITDAYAWADELTQIWGKQCLVLNAGRRGFYNDVCSYVMRFICEI